MFKTIMVACFIFLLVACDNNTIEAESKDYNTQKQKLADKEKENPLLFLSVSSKDKKNLFGSTVIKGIVSNTATVCSYKDVRIRLLSFNKEGKMVEEHEDVINGLIKPNTKKDFTIRYHLPRSADSVALSIMSASVAEE